MAITDDSLFVWSPYYGSSEIQIAVCVACGNDATVLLDKTVQRFFCDNCGVTQADYQLPFAPKKPQ